jgi:hypothetical protein
VRAASGILNPVLVDKAGGGDFRRGSPHGFTFPDTAVSTGIGICSIWIFWNLFL